jgi:pSer/pThr/pTyr-binding forkhead associated (FHA) protein
MQAKVEILVKDRDSVREHHLLIPGEYVIGRGEDCHIVVQGAGVSHRHVQLLVTASRIVVTDLDSTNGTFLENRRLEGSVQISFGDHIRLGKKEAPVLQLLRESFEMSPASFRHNATPNVAPTPGLAAPAGLVPPEKTAPVPTENPNVAAMPPAPGADSTETEYKDRVRALEEALMAAVRTREDLHRRLEREEKERKLQAAAAAEEWTALLHEKEHALEGLAELRATQEYRQKMAARKIQQFREDLKNRENKPEAAPTDLDEPKTAESAPRPEVGPKASAEELVAAAGIIEAQEAELAELRRRLEDIQNRKMAGLAANPLETGILLETAQIPAPAVPEPLPAVSAPQDRNGAAETPTPVPSEVTAHESNPPPAVAELEARAHAIEVSASAPATPPLDEPKPAKVEALDLPEEEPARPPDQPFWAPVTESWNWRWILGGVVVVLFLGVGGYFATIKFKEYQLADLTRTAQTAADKNDFTLASLSARRALQLQPENLTACTIMADMSEKSGDPTAVAWRQRVIEITPDSVDAHVKAALTAIRFNRSDVAGEALAGVPEAERERADYLTAAGQVAAIAKDSAEAERCFTKALALEPQNTRLRFLLAKLQAASDDFFTRDTGRSALSSLGGDSEFGIQALRALLGSYRKTKEVQAALRVSGQVVQNPQHTFSDVLGRLSLLALTKDPALHDELAVAQDSVTKRPPEAAILLGWMNSTGLAAEGIEWVMHRKPEVGQLAEIQTPLTACQVTLGDWNAVLQLTEPGSSTIDEYIRRAYRARALREQRRGLLSQSEWQLAVNAAGRAPDALTWLATVAQLWKWKDEEEQTLWRVAEKNADAMWALRRLSKRYTAEGNTDALRRVAARMLQSDPSDEGAQNDFALLSLLTFKEVERARQMAHDLFVKHPTNAAYTSTYAFGLHLGDQTPEALKVMRTLTVDQLEIPSVAAYYGPMLAANNELREAAHYLELAKRAHLLPQEEKLVSEAIQLLPTFKEDEPRERER